jgi:hypothetical protein
MKFKNDRQRKAVMAKLRSGDQVRFTRTGEVGTVLGSVDRDVEVQFSPTNTKILKIHNLRKVKGQLGWIGFKKGDKLIAKISIEGAFPGEITETRKLLARMQRTKPSKIKVEVIE